MHKIAISGKAGSGKDTFAEMLWQQYQKLPNVYFHGAELVALANPIKEMVKIMFPRTKRKSLYGPSKYRMETIPGAYKNGIPLTYRMLLQDLGTEVGRSYNENIWLDIADYKAEKAENKNRSLFVIIDVRFLNEFEHFKDLGYTMIRIKRDPQYSMSHSSEVEQDSISDSKFNFVILNNGSKDELNAKARSVSMNL